MTFEEIKRRNRQDIMLTWIIRSTSAALLFVSVGCAYQLGQLKKDQSPAEVTLSPAQQRTPADEGASDQGQLKTEMVKLQEENAKLRAQLIELQQKIASQNAKKAEKKVVSTPKVFSKPQPNSRKPSKVQKVASAKKQKKPKVIQISFEEEKETANAAKN